MSTDTIHLANLSNNNIIDVKTKTCSIFFGKKTSNFFLNIVAWKLENKYKSSCCYNPQERKCL